MKRHNAATRAVLALCKQRRAEKQAQLPKGLLLIDAQDVRRGDILLDMTTHAPVMIVANIVQAQARNYFVLIGTHNEHTSRHAVDDVLVKRS